MSRLASSELGRRWSAKSEGLLVRSERDETGHSHSEQSGYLAKSGLGQMHPTSAVQAARLSRRHPGQHRGGADLPPGRTDMIAQPGKLPSRQKTIASGHAWSTHGDQAHLLRPSVVVSRLRI